ncbi:MAG: ABC transporter permease [Calditrichaeota bacterium]|nr:ABC transporter permease [Calditrichota bacterium]
MIIPKLAIRNLLGAGLRTWLNVVVLSFSYVAIIWMQGLYQGMNEQVSRAKIDSEIGGGQFWQENYDPFDPLTLDEAHARIPGKIKNLIEKKQAVPVLILQGAIYPEGKVIPVLLKGIDPRQSILDLPTQFLADSSEELTAIIGSRMAKMAHLQEGDYVTVQWRDINGTFDAREVRIEKIFKTPVQSIDNNQLWFSLPVLQKLTGMTDQATLVTVSQDCEKIPVVEGWKFQTTEVLLADLTELIRAKSVGASILYVVLLFLAMLGIFDTQVLSIFRRRKEIGTLMALGMTRPKVIQLFTLEGAIHSVLAALVAAIYGIPLLIYTAKKGWALPQNTDDYGFAIGDKLFPVYGIGLILGTTILIFVVTTIVSYLPTRKIAKLNPTDALRGKYV